MGFLEYSDSNDFVLSAEFEKMVEDDFIVSIHCFEFYEEIEVLMLAQVVMLCFNNS